ncbi:MAG: hypothetical protein JEZ07_17770 [Phycisphaerae bacterium]|nr:hypothetical protein [Phycisphaerae bacterium]
MQNKLEHTKLYFFKLFIFSFLFFAIIGYVTMGYWRYEIFVPKELGVTYSFSRTAFETYFELLFYCTLTGVFSFWAVVLHDNLTIERKCLYIFLCHLTINLSYIIIARFHCAKYFEIDPEGNVVSSEYETAMNAMNSNYLPTTTVYRIVLVAFVVIATCLLFAKKYVNKKNVC